MVVTCEQYVALETYKVVVECLDALQVEVVGRCVKDETVGVLELHACYHTTHTFASGQHIDLLHNLFAGEQHSSEEALHYDFIARTILAEPVHEVLVAVEELRVVERQICRCDGNSPFVCAGIGLAIAVYYLEEGCHGFGIVAEEHHFFTFLYVEAHIVEQNCSVGIDSFETFHLKNLVARFALHLEDDARIFAA